MTSAMTCQPNRANIPRSSASPLRSPLTRHPLGRTIAVRLFVAAGASWLFAAALGLWFATWTSGRFRLETLQLPGVVPVALAGSTVAALLIAPLAAWSMRTGPRNLRLFVPALWLVLATGIAFGVGLLGTFLIALLGVVGLALIPPSDSHLPSDANPDLAEPGN